MSYVAEELPAVFESSVMTPCRGRCPPILCIEVPHRDDHFQFRDLRLAGRGPGASFGPRLCVQRPDAAADDRSHGTRKELAGSMRARRGECSIKLTIVQV